MPLEQWSSGEQITKTKLNATVDKVNADQARIDDLETDMAGKAAVCSDAGQDVAATGAAGSASTASRCDHKHAGVSRIIAGTGISISPTAGKGDVTITATGGGVTIETYTLTLGSTVIHSASYDTLATISMPSAILGMSVEATFDVSANPQRIELDLKGSVHQDGLTNTMILHCAAGASGTVFNPGGCAAVGLIQQGDTSLIIAAISTYTDITLLALVVKIYYIA